MSYLQDGEKMHYYYLLLLLLLAHHRTPRSDTIYPHSHAAFSAAENECHHQHSRLLGRPWMYSAGPHRQPRLILTSRSGIGSGLMCYNAGHIGARWRDVDASLGRIALALRRSGRRCRVRGGHVLRGGRMDRSILHRPYRWLRGCTCFHCKERQGEKRGIECRIYQSTALRL